jgi:purine-binding chemotaxis protein CheW
MSDVSAPSQELAQEAPQDAVSIGENETMALMLVRVAGRWFTLDARLVQEVAVKGAVTRVPTAPRHVLGIAGLRGGLVPVVSLEQMLAVLGPSTSDTAATLPRLVVVRSGEFEVGLVVDEIRGIINAMPPAHAPETGTPGHPTFLWGEFEWQGNLVRMLDVPRLLAAAAERGQGGD